MVVTVKLAVFGADHYCFAAGQLDYGHTDTHAGYGKILPGEIGELLIQQNLSTCFLRMNIDDLYAVQERGAEGFGNWTL